MTVEEILAKSEAASLIAFAVANQHRFQTATAISPGASKGPASFESRHARVLSELGDVARSLAEGVRAALPEGLERLQIRNLAPTSIETHLVALNDGDAFRLDSRVSLAESPTRAVGWALFVYRDPNAFSGGQIEFVPTSRSRSRGRTTKPERLAPASNSLLLFPSGMDLEILPIQSRSEDFGDSLFVAYGWVHA